MEELTEDKCVCVCVFLKRMKLKDGGAYQRKRSRSSSFFEGTKEHMKCISKA